MTIQWFGCNEANFRRGRGSLKPTAIVIHLMAGTLPGTDAWFNNSLAGVSAHYGIGQRGDIHQYVKEEDEAFHAGQVVDPTWTGIIHGMNPNLYTVGIEHEGKLDTVWSDDIFEASGWLVAQVAERWGIPLDRAHVIGHHEIKASKPCPGPHCDLDRIILTAKEVLNESQGQAGTKHVTGESH